MAVPADVRPLVRRRMWRQYLGQIPEPEARLAALQLALKCQLEIDRLRQLLTPGAVGGAGAFELPRAAIHPDSAKNIKRAPLPVRASTRQSAQESRVAVDPPLTMLQLVDTWRRVTQPRAERSVRRLGKVASTFARVVKIKDARQVTRQDVMHFREHLEQMKITRGTATNYLQGLHRLFAVAHSEGLITDNPAAGILMRKDPGRYAERDRRRPFTTQEVQQIFAALADAPVAFAWIVRLLAYHGARSGEIVQLHKGDVSNQFGVPVLRIHDKHGSLKNRYSLREIPLHPSCAAFLDYVAGVPGPRIFPIEVYAAAQFQHYAGKFIRTKATILNPTVTMHSLRHTWRTLAREVGMPSPVSRAIMGHAQGSDVHDGYGTVPSLKLRAEWIARIDPLADF